jgi:hypothetical protein
VDSIEGIKIECDEDGWHLILEGDFVDTFKSYLADESAGEINLRFFDDVALKLANEETKQIRLWWQEGQAAAASYIPPVEPHDCGYELSDPKHPTFHDRMAEYTDSLRKAHRQA